MPTAWSGFRSDAANRDLLAKAFAVSDAISLKAPARESTWALLKLTRLGPSGPSQALPSTLGFSGISESLTSVKSFWTMILTTLILTALTVKPKFSLGLLACIGLMSLLGSARADLNQDCLDMGSFGGYSGEIGGCYDCAPGEHYNDDGDGCVDCEAGTYQTNYDQEDCLACPIAKQPTADRTSCECKPESTVPGTGDCYLCDKGTRYVNGACDSCPSGEYQNERDQTECKTCPEGKTVTGDKTDCVCSEVDTVYDDTDKLCKPCPAGTEYSSGSCTKCEAGKYRSDLASASCVSCSANMIPNADQTDCIKGCTGGALLDELTSVCYTCGRGHFINDENSGICEACGEDLYQDGLDAHDCKTCDGELVPNDDQSDCITDCNTDPLVPKKYDEETASCYQCGRGEYISADTDGVYTCSPCAGLDYQDELDQAECKKCPTGKTSAESGTSCSQICSDGQYVKIVESLPQCVDCPAGSYLENNDCLTCGSEKVSTAVNSQACVSCDEGKVPNEDQTDCVVADPAADCGAGQYWNVTAEACADCPTGTKAVNHVCEGCPVGTYQSQEGQTDCGTCAEFMKPNEDQTDCIKDCGELNYDLETDTCYTCGPGEFLNEGGACEDCPADKYQDGLDAADCKSCDAGKEPNEAQDDCVAIDCPEGEVYDDETSACVKCLPGTHELNGACVDCEVDTYQALEGKTSCDACTGGRIVNEAKDDCDCADGSVYDDVNDKCNQCEPGHYEVNGACLECGENKVQVNPGATECTPCTGNEVANADLTECICATGYSRNDTTQNCEQCGAGSKEVEGVCEPCESGSVQSLPGMTSCDVCVGGSAPSDDKTECECPAGQEFVENVCTKCQPGNFEDEGECAPCGEGEVINSEGASECTPCQGVYVPNVARTECICPSGYGFDEESNNCEECQPGTYSKDGMCEDCGEGKVQPDSGESDCNACTGGAVASEDKTQCNCPSGQGVVEDVCTKCTAGNYAVNNTCEPCGEDEVQAAEEASSCDICTEGKVPNEAHTACECPSDTVYDAEKSQCAGCGIGKFAAGDHCESCDVNEIQPNEKATGCTTCTGGSSANVEMTQCDCTDGYGFLNGICTICEPGTFDDNNECVPCGEDEAQSASGATSCDTCTGDLIPNEDKTDCVCPAGSEEVDGACAPCEEGEYLLEGVCTSCPEGQVQPGTGKEECIACVGGQVANENQTECECPAGQEFVDSVCTECTPGYYEKEGVCTICDAGKVQSESGKDSCDECTGGSVANEDQTECDCPTGEGIVDAVCTQCTAGQYAVNNLCQACDEGKVQKLAGQTSCEECTGGSAANEDQTDCDCPTGEGFVEGVCTQCTAGHYAVNNVCEVCEAGKIQLNPGATSCEECTDGKEPNEDKTECNCPTGEGIVDAVCTQCTAGHYAINNVCEVCEAGKVQGAPGATSCEECTGGSEANEDQTECDCPTGEGFVEDVCTQCTAGHYAVNNACEVCEAGKVQANPGATSCEECTGGREPNEGKTECVCPTGEGIVDAACTQCTAGHYAINNACEVCEAGKVQEAAGATSCEECTGGRVPNEDQTECVCPTGEGIVEGVCTQCTAGQYAVNNVCQACDEGKVQKLAGQTSCEECTGGSEANEDQTDCDCPTGEGFVDDVCTQCTAGHYAVNNVCEVCEAGKAQEAAGATSCEECTAPKITNEDQTACVCPAGYEHNDETGDCDICLEGTSETEGACVACEAGKVQPSQGQSSCNSCTGGSSPNEAKTDCVCPTGYGFDELDTCVECTAGHFAKDSICEPCGEGEVQEGTGATECVACTGGKIPNEAKTECACPAGSVFDEELATCEMCEPGTIEEAGECVACGANEVQANAGQTECDTCTGGSSPNANQTQCDCPAGEGFVENTCAKCQPGKYALDNECVACDSDKIQPNEGATSCDECDHAKVPNEDQTECVCSPGTEVDGDTGDCTPCAAGEKEVAGECVACGENEIQSATGMTSCDTCENGKVANDEHTECKCPAGNEFDAENSQCVKCTVGKKEENGACVACPEGEVQAEEGQTSCNGCTGGSAANEAQTQCDCPEGQGFNGDNECEECAVGHFAEANECKLCGENEIQSAAASTLCTPCEGIKISNEDHTECVCPAGQELDENGDCAECQPGTYENEGKCEPCEAGKVQPGTKQTSCTACTGGSVPNELLTVCECPGGQHFDGDNNCIDCEAGTYEKDGACEPCTDGKVQGTAGSTECVACTNGKVANEDLTDCVCQNGEGVNATTGDCETCEAGTHSENSACVECEAGSVQSSPGQVECTACPGEKVPNADKTDCECPEGTELSEDGDTCDGCKPGEYEKDEDCVPCEEGKVQPGYGASDCTACENGKIPNADRTECVCPAGSEYDEDQTKCVNCQPGYFENEGVCEQCGEGKYRKEEASSSCETCNEGFIVNEDHTDCECPDGSILEVDTCVKCSAGFSETDGACVECEAGKFQSAEGKTSCEECTNGREVNEDRTECKCAPGTVYDDASEEENKCIPCVAGKYESKGACVVCEAGKYQNETGTTECKLCEDDLVPNADQTDCVEPDCSDGKIYNKDSVEEDHCDECPKGTREENGACVNCEVNTHQPSTGQTSCLPCNQGEIQPEEGKESCYVPTCNAGSIYNAASTDPSYCDPCPAGTSEYNGVCVDCVAGSYQTEAGKTSCTLCSKGTFSAAVGASSADTCQVCPSGEIQSAAGKTTCNACPKGTYQKDSDHTKCVDCPAGTANSDTAQSKCEACPAGSFTRFPKQLECTLCPVNTFQPDSGKTSCKLCPFGQAQPKPGQDKCVSMHCPDGSIFNPKSENVDYCDECPAGTYQFALLCIPCLPGTFQDNPGKTQCKECPAGSVQKKLGQKECKLCPTGTMQDRKGKTHCIDCPEGRYQNLEGQAQCKQCDVGTYNNEQRAITCELCPAGTYQHNMGQTHCDKCSEGTYQNELGKTGCKSCIPGEVQAMFGQDHCDQCPISQYQPEPKQASCMVCPEGQYTSDLGSTSCKTCPDGFYPDVYQSKCLYKGLFNSKTEFDSSDFKTGCFDEDGALVKPFTAECRDVFRTICCLGSYKNSVVNCNYALELMDSSLKDNYCTACTFMDWSSCPRDGLCWNDETWTDNTQDPYILPVTNACYRAIAPYCLSKITINPNDVECKKLAHNCNGAISGSAYGGNWNKFKISFTDRMFTDTTSCANFIDMSSNPALTTGKMKCSATLTPAIFVVHVDKLNAPILEFTTVAGKICDPCGKCLPAITQQVAPPSPALETATLSAVLNDACNSLTVTVSVEKPYPWNTEVRGWEVTYENNNGVSQDTLDKFEGYKDADSQAIVISGEDFYKGKKLFFKAIIATPFKTTVVSDTIHVTFPNTPFGESVCSNCRLRDKTKCLMSTNYNDVHHHDHDHDHDDRFKAGLVEEVGTSSAQYAVYGVLGFLLVGFVLIELVSLFADGNALKAGYTAESTTSSTVASRGFLYRIFALFSHLKRRGFAQVGSFEIAKTQTEQTCEASATETNRHIQEPNTKFNEIPNCDINRIAQAHIDSELIREPITFWSVLKHLHFYVSLLAKSEINAPRSVKALIGLTALLGELVLTGVCFYFFDTMTAIVCGVSAALLMTVWKVVISSFLVKRYITDDMTPSEIEAQEKSHLKRRVAGMLLASVWIMGCIAGIILLSLSFTDSMTYSWMEAFAAAAAMELIILPVLKIFFIIGFGSRLAKMVQNKSKILESKAFINVMDFGLNYC